MHKEEKGATDEQIRGKQNQIGTKFGLGTIIELTRAKTNFEENLEGQNGPGVNKHNKFLKKSKVNQIYPEEGRESAKSKRKRTKQHKSVWRRRKLGQTVDRCTRIYNHK